MEPVLPLIAVGNDLKLEGGAVQQHKLHGGDGVHLLHLVAQFGVLVDGDIKVHHLRALVAPSLEEGILLGLPDHFESAFSERGRAQ